MATAEPTYPPAVHAAYARQAALTVPRWPYPALPLACFGAPVEGLDAGADDAAHDADARWHRDVDEETGRTLWTRGGDR